MESEYDQTPEARRLRGFHRRREEKYLLERSPEDMQQDLRDAAEGKLNLAIVYEGMAVGLEAEAIELHERADNFLNNTEASEC